jgi:predicted Zn finger-like uncharacterized protein
MLIVCPSCATSYDLEARLLGPGRPVRCVRCRTVWTAAPAPAMAGEGEPEAPGATALAALPDDEAALAADPAWGIVEDDGATAAPAEPASAEPGEALTVDPGFEAPSLVPHVAAGTALVEGSARTHEELDSHDIETFATRRLRLAREARSRRRQGKFGLPLMLLLLAACCAALLAGRERVVALAPQSASIYAALGMPVNLRGLVFQNLRSMQETHDKVPMLIVEGTIANVTDRAMEVPRLRFALRNKDGLEIYAWTALASGTLLSAGEQLPFRTQLASPPSEGRDVVVRFFNRRDLDVR